MDPFRTYWSTSPASTTTAWQVRAGGTAFLMDKFPRWRHFILFSTQIKHPAEQSEKISKQINKILDAFLVLSHITMHFTD